MDKKLLDALNNVSEAIALLAETLDSKQEARSSTGQALQTSDIGEKLKSLDLGIKELQKDTKEILKNQKTIMGMATKKNDKTEQVADMGDDPKKKKSIKDGVSLILLIAIGVLAIGLAFKIVGEVDFTSVLALAIALPLVAYAFEKIAEIKSLKPSEMASLIIVTIAISTAIAASSFILRLVQPVGIFQLITAAFIAAAFGAVSYGIGNLIVGLKKAELNVFDIAKIAAFLPLALIAVSVAIAGSSVVLKMVQPVGIFQLFTAVLIAAMFGAISFGLGKLLEGISKFKNPAQAAVISTTLPVLLVGVATAIALSSVPLSMIQPIGLFQFFTAVMIAIVFIPISFAIPFLAKAIDQVKVEKVSLFPQILVALALSILLTSYLFALIPSDKITISLLLKTALLAVTLGILAISLGLTLAVFDKFNITVDKAIEGGLVVVIISIAIAVSSRILALGSYENAPPFDWSLGVALSLTVFGIAMIAVGSFAMTLAGPEALILGALSVLLIASTIVATGIILSLGKYDVFPSLDWSKSIGLSLLAFGTSMVLLGSFVVATFGVGAAALAAGSAAVLGVASTIVSTSIILKQGTYTGGPTKDWAEGIAIALGAFAPVYRMLVGNIFGLGVGPDDFNKAIEVVTGGIVQAAKSFSEANAAFTIGPPAAWAEGVGLAIGAFAPVYKMLMGNIIGLGVSPKEFISAIDVVTKGIVQSAVSFSEANASFINGPPVAWAEGVGKAIGAFAPVYAILAESKGIFGGPSVEDMVESIEMISSGIVAAAKFFNSPDNSGVFDVSKVPPTDWSSNVGAAIKSFSPVFDFITKNNKWYGSVDADDLQDIVLGVAESIVSVSNELAKGNFNTRMNPNFIDNLSSGIKKFIDLISFVDEKGSSDFDVLDNYADALVNIADAYEEFADSVDSLNSAISNIDLEKMQALRSLTGGIVLMSLMDADQFETMMDALEDKAEIFVDTINELEGETGKSEKGPSAKMNRTSEVKTDSGKPAASLGDVLTEVRRVSMMLGSIATYTKSIQTHVINKDDKVNLGNKK